MTNKLSLAPKYLALLTLNMSAVLMKILDESHGNGNYAMLTRLGMSENWVNKSLLITTIHKKTSFNPTKKNERLC